MLHLFLNPPHSLCSDVHCASQTSLLFSAETARGGEDDFHLTLTALIRVQGVDLNKGVRWCFFFLNCADPYDPS